MVVRASESRASESLAWPGVHRDRRRQRFTAADPEQRAGESGRPYAGSDGWRHRAEAGGEDFELPLLKILYPPVRLAGSQSHIKSAASPTEKGMIRDPGAGWPGVTLITLISPTEKGMIKDPAGRASHVQVDGTTVGQ